MDITRILGSVLSEIAFAIVLYKYPHLEEWFIGKWRYEQVVKEKLVINRYDKWYPKLEIAGISTALLVVWGIFVKNQGMVPMGFLYSVVLLGLYVGGEIDRKYRLIPNQLNIFLAFVALLIALMSNHLYRSVLIALVVLAIMGLLKLAMGDVKLVAVLASVVGAWDSIFWLVAATIIMLLLVFSGRQSKGALDKTVPLAMLLSSTAVLAMLFGVR